MTRSWQLRGLHLLLTGLSILAIGAATVYADPKAEDRKPKKPNQNRPEWNEPTVMGIVMDTYWAPGLKPGTQTATIVIWSNESDLAVTIWGDGPEVREAIVNGTACVGRYVVVGGNRLDENSLVGLAIHFADTAKQCERTLT
jgi:hypothetical protein